MRSAYRTVFRPPLADFVDGLWVSEGYVQPHAAERILPTGTMTLVLELEEHGAIGELVSGARSRFEVLDTSRPLSLLGVRFKAGGGFPFFGLPAGELQDQSAALDTFWGPEARQLREQLLEATDPAARFGIVERFLLWRLRYGPQRDPAVTYAIDAFRHPTQEVSVAAVIERTGFSSRRFIATFRDEVGLTPKLFARVSRFRRVITALQSAHPPDLASLALDCGYFDQAHFNHDFRAFAGVSPLAYLRDRTSTNHVRLG
jgi:AraC-like DNA-binding protein